MYPLLLPSFGLVVGLVCPRHMVGWPQCVCTAVAAFQLGPFRCRYFVDMWVAEGHTQHDDRGLGTQQVPMVVRHSWEQWSLRGCVCQSRSFNPHWLPQMVGEAWEDEGTILRHSFVGLSRGGDGPL